jgi:hypothetical protein
MSRFVKIGAWTRQCDVRLELKMIVENKRILSPNDCMVANRTFQGPARLTFGCGVPAIDRRHVDDLAFDQLYASVLVQDTCLARPVNR